MKSWCFVMMTNCMSRILRFRVLVAQKEILQVSQGNVSGSHADSVDRCDCGAVNV